MDKYQDQENIYEISYVDKSYPSLDIILTEK